MIPAFPWRVLLLKLAALFSFCGGPLLLADSLKLYMDKDVAFAITFLPSVALIFGVYSLWGSIPDRWDKVVLSFGSLGAIALVGMNAFAIWELAKRPERADAVLIELGIAIGTVFAVYYAYVSHKVLSLAAYGRLTTRSRVDAP